MIVTYVVIGLNVVGTVFWIVMRMRRRAQWFAEFDCRMTHEQPCLGSATGCRMTRNRWAGRS